MAFTPLPASQPLFSFLYHLPPTRKAEGEGEGRAAGVREQRRWGGRQEAGPLVPTWHVLLPRLQTVGCPPVSLHGHFRHRLSGGSPSSGTWRWGRPKKEGLRRQPPDQYGTTPPSLSSQLCASPHSLCPTRRRTFMPLVRHTPPCKLSRPSRVPSDVAGREESKGEVGSPEPSPYSVPIPRP